MASAKKRAIRPATVTAAVGIVMAFIALAAYLWPHTSSTGKTSRDTIMVGDGSQASGSTSAILNENGGPRMIAVPADGRPEVKTNIGKVDVGSVSSNNQSGGTTAAVVNNGGQPK